MPDSGGSLLLDEVLSKREQINEVLRVKLDEVTERWGGKVTTVEIREITPPRDVQDAMNRQLSAERTRRAVITESEGNRQAAIMPTAPMSSWSASRSWVLVSSYRNFMSTSPRKPVFPWREVFCSSC